MEKRLRYYILSFVLFTAISGIWWMVFSLQPENKEQMPIKPEFDAQRAYADVEYQLSLGPRIPGSTAHEQINEWIQQSLQSAGWKVTIHDALYNQPIKNIIARRDNGGKWILLAAHYDSRIFADQDPEISKHTFGVPGANDGASGVAVLLELARVIPRDVSKNIWLVFFDAEDNGKLPGWDWILGARAFVRDYVSMDNQPDAVVVMDMVGDKDLQIFFELNSDRGLSTEIWDQANKLGYSEYFIPQEKYRILDDHIPFIQAGVRAVDIIDFDYPFWHTTSDTLDKVSSQSLRIVGVTILSWLLNP